MAVSKVSLSIDEEVLAEARDRAGRRELSSYVTDALRRQLQHDRLGELLAELDDTAGPIPDELMEEARQLWRGAVEGSKTRRRSA
jgi:Arc/MetJ family transcription regulator